MIAEPSGGIQVLHVDDEPGLADMAAEYVGRLSDRVEVETTTGASEALERIRTDSFHCVVSDYDMPEMNGIELLKVVREEYPDLPFILYTGKGSEEVASDAISAGVTDYLQKEGGTSQYEVLANRITNSVDKYRAQHQLEDRKRRLDLFVEQSPLGVIRWNENFELERMNEKASEILGYDETDLKGHSWEAIVPGSDRDAVAEVVSNLLENKGGYHSVNENIRKDGKHIVCEWHNRVVTDDGEVIAIYSQFQDVTERRKRERRFEAIFNNTHTFTGLMDPDGTLLEANDTALSFGDVDREEVVGQPIWDTYWFEAYEDAREAAKQAVEQARNGELFRDEVRVRGDDTDAIIDFSVRPVFDENGAVTSLVPEGRDITERKEQEEELRETKAELEAAINETERQNRAFEAFLDNVNDPSLSYDDQMTEVLDLGVEYLDLEIGIISNIDPPDYTVEHVVSAGESIEQGTVLDFRDMFCTRVYEADGPVAFHSPEEGDVKDHPCYQKLGLQAYLGEPLIVDGNRYGTLNFSSSKPREEPFTDGEQAFVRAIAEWVSKELSRRQREEEIHRLHQLHQTVLSNMRETVLLTDDDGQMTYVCPNVQFIFGYDDEKVADMGSIEALIGENLFEPETLEAAGEIRNLETTITDAEGQEHAVLVTVRRVDIEDGTRLYSIRDITERKDRERELERMTDLFEEAQEIAELGAWETDLRNDSGWWTEQVNQIYGLHTGYEPDPGEGIEYFHPDDQPVIRDAFDRAKEAGEPYDLELRVVHGEETKWVRTRGKPQFEDGEMVKVRGTIQDITEHKEREAELQQERARLDALFQHSTDSVVFTEFVDGEPIVRDVNTAFEETFGYEEKSAVGRPIDELVVPEETEKIQEAKKLNRRVEAGELVETEVRRRTPDGIRDFLLQSIPLEPGESGTRTYAIYSDITERKERERELERQEAYLEQSSDIISVMDSKGEVKYQSASTERVTNFSPAEVIGDSGFEHVHPDDLEQFEEEFLQFVSQPNTEVQEEFRVETKDGDWRWIEVRGVNKLDDPVIDGLLFSSRDITERKEREEALQRKRDRLDQFASVVSHDLRNPLNVVQGRIDLAQEECETEHLDAAARGVERSLDLIEDMLELARAGQAVSETEPVELADLADDCWDTVETADAEIRVDLNSTIQADRSRLRQMFENLFSNAIEHGGNDVTVRIGSLPEGIYIEDDGPGIPHDEREKIWDSGYSGSDDGTGFGLAIVNQIVEAHRWDIRITDGSDGGARFEIVGVEVVAD